MDIWRAKKEIQHRILDAKKNSHRDSARFTHKIGGTFKTQTGQPAKLVDKVIYPMDICPHCGSKATYHRRMSMHGLPCSNVWSYSIHGLEGGLESIGSSEKFDYCLDCHKEFLMELYIFKIPEEKALKKKRKEGKEGKGWLKRLFR